MRGTGLVQSRPLQFGLRKVHGHRLKDRARLIPDNQLGRLRFLVRIKAQGHRNSFKPHRSVHQSLHPDPARNALKRAARQLLGQSGENLVGLYLLFDRRKCCQLRRIFGGIDRIERILILGLRRKHAEKRLKVAVQHSWWSLRRGSLSRGRRNGLRAGQVHLSLLNPYVEPG